MLTGCGASGDEGKDTVASSLVPPPSARVQTTACAYCIVGCGYKAYTWPTGDESGDAQQNALGAEFPVSALAGTWISPEMYSRVSVEGVPHHLVIVPDADAKVVNRRGDHNLGASLAKKLYDPGGDSDRLHTPMLRWGSELIAVSWEDAISLVAGVSQHTLATAGPLAWGMKTYSYQFYENTYAITKLAFEGVRTPCWAPHDKPRDASDTPGLSDAGINAFSASYQDWELADVLLVSGVSLYEAHSVLFSQWVMGGPELIVVNPRREPTAVYAEEQGGLFLQVRPGTDTLLHNAIAREILLAEAEDTAFIESWCASEAELSSTAAGSWRRERFGLSPEQYREFIVNTPEHELGYVAEQTGVPTEKIEEAARRLTAVVDGRRRRASFMFEKGNYWTHNYSNTASLASLALLCGAGNREGQVISRAGGHQRGMIKAAEYPMDLSPHEVGGYPATVNLDTWAEGGNLRFAWVIGCTWAGGGTARAGRLYESLKAQVSRGAESRPSLDVVFPDGPEGSLDVSAVLAHFTQRIDQGGLVMVHQDLYPQALGELCDLLLPAAGWGEAPFNRMQGERRLRHYPKIADPPGQARPDWQIVAEVARKMGLPGFDWSEAEQVFVEASEASGGPHDYRELVAHASSLGLRPTELLASMGTTGIQCPVRQGSDGLEGTLRLHEDGFSTPTGRALFVRGGWDEVLPHQQKLAPMGDELWIINRRHSGTWSAMVEDRRIPYRSSLFDENWIELRTEDATARGITDGDRVVISARPIDTEESPNGAILPPVEGRAKLVEGLESGVACMYFNWGGEPRYAANNLVPTLEDPINGLFAFKLGRGRVERAESG